MESQNRVYFGFIALLFVDFIALFWFLNTLSISFDEALFFYSPYPLQSGTLSLAWLLSHVSVQYFGYNDVALRLPFLCLHFCNVLLLFLLAKSVLKRVSDALFCAILFCLLPGINALALLLSHGGILTFFTLLLCFLTQRSGNIPYWLLCVMALLDKGFALIFLALIFYGIANKNTRLIVISLVLFALNMYLYGLEIGGHPRGYFLDFNGHLMLIFSPLLYLYFLYTLYWYFNAKHKPLMWYIAFCALCFMGLLSLRQRVQIETFAPLLLPALPLMVGLYFSGLRVRLPQFRMRYKAPFFVTFLILICSFLLLILSKPIFVLIPDANAHFAQRHFLAKELAFVLKQNGIDSVTAQENLQTRLAFYGIQKGGLHLSQEPIKDAKEIPIMYYNKSIARYYVW